MAVTLDGTTLDHILDWNTEEETTIAIPQFVNKITPTIDEDIWDRSPNIFTITCRVSDTNKAAIETSAGNHAIVVLNVDGTPYNVWIRTISSQWKGDINFAKPWLVGIELIEND